jgi:hypothetical protein
MNDPIIPVIAARGRRLAAAAVMTLAAALPAPAVRAIQRDLGTQELQRAIKMGSGSDADRARFHAAYIVPLSSADPAIERLEVLTEFRRVVIEAEDRLRKGDHMFGAGQASGVIRAWHDKVTLVLRLRFHPQNVLVTVPSYELTLGDRGPAPLDIRRTPVYAMTGTGQKPGTAMYGATVEADFDVAAVGRTSRSVRVLLQGKELARATVNVAQID